MLPGDGKARPPGLEVPQLAQHLPVRQLTSDSADVEHAFLHSVFGLGHLNMLRGQKPQAACAQHRPAGSAELERNRKHRHHFIFGAFCLQDRCVLHSHDGNKLFRAGCLHSNLGEVRCHPCWLIQVSDLEAALAEARNRVQQDAQAEGQAVSLAVAEKEQMVKDLRAKLDAAVKRGKGVVHENKQMQQTLEKARADLEHHESRAQELQQKLQARVHDPWAGAH